MEQQLSSTNTSVVIVTYLSDEIIERCIKNLKNKNNIIIIENSNRKDFKKKIEEKYDNVKCYLMGYDAGFAKAANYGIKLVKSEYVFLINPDTFPEENCLEKLEIFANTSNNSPIIFPLSLRKNNKISYDFGFFNNYKIKNVDQKYIRVDYSNGNAIFIKKKFFVNNNVFDENFFLQFDDTDLCWRLKKQKRDLFIVTEAKVKHLEGESHQKKFDFELKKEVWWHNGWSHIYLAKKHFKKKDLIFLIIKKLFTSLFKSIGSLFVFKIQYSFLYFMNVSGIICSLLNTKSFYRSKINQN